MNNKSSLLCIGYGYSAKRVTDIIDKHCWEISVTSRKAHSKQQNSLYDKLHIELSEEKIIGSSDILYPVGQTAPEFATTISPFFWQQEGCPMPVSTNDTATQGNYDVVLVSVPPDSEGDRFLRKYGKWLASRVNRSTVIIYLSSTGVYGDNQGRWVTEESPCHPTTERGRRRCLAEAQWEQFSKDAGLKVAIFRLAGIYGPGRNMLEKMLQLGALGSQSAGFTDAASRIFSRIHRDDIAHLVVQYIAHHTGHIKVHDQAIIETSHQSGKEIYNLSDKEPASSTDIREFVIELLSSANITKANSNAAPINKYPDITHVPNSNIDHNNKENNDSEPQNIRAKQSFWRDEKKVDGNKILNVLNCSLMYPTYREGLQDILSKINQA